MTTGHVKDWHAIYIFWRQPLVSLLVTFLFHTSHSFSSLLAVALDDFSVIIFDLDTKRIVRKMSNASFLNRCAAKVMDLSFSPDGWLTSHGR